MSSEMTTRPNQQTPEVYDRLLRGFYGQFKSDKSFPLSYVQASIPITQIEWLETATEAFRANALDFEELVQRDIDKQRVLDIANQYLKKGEERVLFFPPLLAATVALDEHGMLKQFESKKEEIKSNDAYITWGEDRFQLILPTSEAATGHEIFIAGKPHHIMPYWSILRLNSNKIKLVVIDGQHRLQALKHLWLSSDQTNKKVVREINIPVCILFTPNAVQDENSHEKISMDLRELFVRINQTGKKVSGHFIALLDDGKLSSFSVREFCNLAKKAPLSHDCSKLNCIEWNQRVDKFAAQVTRSYSVTTIQIISDTLAEHAFDQKSAGLTPYILDLKARAKTLETDDGVPATEISNENFSVSQIETLRELIRDKVAPAMLTLFFLPKVYHKRVLAFDNAVKWLQGEISQNKEGAEHCKVNIIDQYREANKLDTAPSIDMYSGFKRKVTEASCDDEDSVYFLNVFQQGLIRSWINLSKILFNEGIEPEKLAEALVKALEISIMDPSKRLLDPSNSYTQKILYNGGRVNLTKSSKRAWTNLIGATMANTKVRKSFIERCGKQGGFETSLCAYGEESHKDYLDELRGTIHADFRKNWRDKELDEQIIQQLETLEQGASHGDETASEELNRIIQEYAEKRYKDAARKLSASLGI